MSLSLSKKQLLGFAIFTILIVSVSFFYYQSTLNYIESNKQVQHFQQLTNQLEIVISLLKDAETGQRGYVITKNDNFLEPYNDALLNLETQINVLDSLLTNDAAGKEKLSNLIPLIQKRIERLQIGIRYIEEDDRQSAVRYIQSGESKLIMDRVRDVIEKWKADENKKLLALLQTTEANSRTNQAIMFTTVAIILLSLIIGQIFLIREIHRKQQLEQELHISNEDLLASNEEYRAINDDLQEANLQLETKQQELTSALKELDTAKEEITQANISLEKRVDERTRKLAESENFLSSIIDQTPVSTWIADKSGTQIRVNDACLKLFGVEDASAGLGKYNILKDNTLQDQPFFKDIQAVFTEGKIARFSCWYNVSEVDHIEVPHGRELYLSATIFPIRNMQGEITNVVIKHEDITQQVRSEQALKASEEQLRLITDALPVLIAYVTKDERYKFVNRAYTEWFNKTKEEIIGNSVTNIIGQEAFEKTKNSFYKSFSGQEVNFEGFMPYEYGEHRYTKANFIPHIVNGKVEGCIVLVNDISSLRKTQEELKRNNEKLTRVNIDLDNFIYTASHDLRSPIVNMEGLYNILDNAFSNRLKPHEEKAWHMLHTSIERLKKTITYLGDVTKAVKGLEDSVEVISVPEAVEDVKPDIRNLIEEAQPVFHTHYDVNQVSFNRDNFRSIVYNLLSNAIKYRNPDQPLIIDIQTKKEGQFIVLSIRDNGLGLDTDQQNKLFNMFRRLHTHVQGTGIGLYIIKRIIENKGGKITLESIPGQGSVFHVYFPGT